MAQVSRTGQVTNVFDLGDYEVHHDYVFDDNGNMLILASDKKQDSTEDVVVKLDVNSGEVTKVLDLGALFGEYKRNAKKRRWRVGLDAYQYDPVDGQRICAVKLEGDFLYYKGQ